MFPGDITVFKDRGWNCESPRCRLDATVHTLRWYRWEGRVRVVEHFYCLPHGEAFARRYRVELEAAPDESGLR